MIEAAEGHLDVPGLRARVALGAMALADRWGRHADDPGQVRTRCLDVAETVVT